MANKLNLLEDGLTVDVQSVSGVIQSIMTNQPSSRFGATRDGANGVVFGNAATIIAGDLTQFTELTYTVSPLGVLVFDDFALVVNPFGRQNIRNFGELVSDWLNGRLGGIGASPQDPSSWLGLYIDQFTKKIWVTDDEIYASLIALNPTAEMVIDQESGDFFEL